jgi:hypothetical protein
MILLYNFFSKFSYILIDAIGKINFYPSFIIKIVDSDSDIKF